MPIYAYKCESCGHRQDFLQKISDPLLTACPACGASAFVKQVTAAGFQLKGSGWYVTDFRNGGGGSKPSAAEAAAKPGSASAPATPAAAGKGDATAPAAAAAGASGTAVASGSGSSGAAPAGGCGSSCACH